MKKCFLLIICVILTVCIAGCGCSGGKSENVTPEDTINSAAANEYLTNFFASYTDMCDYISSSGVALSSFTLDGATLPQLLKALYQSQSVTYEVSSPIEISEDVFSAEVTVFAPDMYKLYEVYSIDKMNLTEEPTADFVVNSFYSNLNLGTTTTVTSEKISLTLSYANGAWSLMSSDELVNAIFPNIGMLIE